METLIIALIVLMAGMYIVSYYFSIKDSTTAMEILKVAALEKIDKMPVAYSIQKIDYVIAGNAISLCLYTNPASDFDLSAEEEGIRETIENATSFETVNISINAPCA
ncbi:MAG: hypothetical protein NTW59_03145 [Candidatus Diapherotrites archaeon]|nr:hypothetical protein [Candidatus Diapherotrites archaeon]